MGGEVYQKFAALHPHTITDPHPMAPRSPQRGGHLADMTHAVTLPLKWGGYLIGSFPWNGEAP